VTVHQVWFHHLSLLKKDTQLAKKIRTVKGKLEIFRAVRGKSTTCPLAVWIVGTGGICCSIRRDVRRNVADLCKDMD